MRTETYGDEIAVNRCDVCAGLWVKPEALQKMKEAWLAEAVLDIGDPRVGSSLNDLGAISCPEGHGVMEAKADEQQSHIWFEQCSTCHGIFLDAGEFTDLKFNTVMDRVRGLLKRANLSRR